MPEFKVDVLAIALFARGSTGHHGSMKVLGIYAAVFFSAAKTRL